MSRRGAYKDQINQKSHNWVNQKSHNPDRNPQTDIEVDIVLYRGGRSAAESLRCIF